MIPISDLRNIAKGRLKDAEVLYASGRYDGAIYLCGYAIEVMLKARICRVLKWPGYPETNREFERFQSFRTHDFDALLRLSGIENKIRTNHYNEWNDVLQWDPSVRYKAIGTTVLRDVEKMIQSTKVILGALWSR